MLNEYTRTYTVNGAFNNAAINRVDVSIEYRKGGMSYWDGTNRPRGYYFSISPYKLVDHGNGFISREVMIGAHGSGSCGCVLPCERQSKKRFETACGMMNDLIDKYMPNFLAEHGIELDGDGYTERYSERR